MSLRTEFNKRNLNIYTTQVTKAGTGILRATADQITPRLRLTTSLLQKLKDLQTTSDDFQSQFDAIQHEIATLQMIDDAISPLKLLLTNFNLTHSPKLSTEQEELWLQELKILDVLVGGVYSWGFASYVKNPALFETQKNLFLQQIQTILRLNTILFKIAETDNIPFEHAEEYRALKQRALDICKKHKGHNLATNTLDNLNNLAEALEIDHQKLLTVPASVNANDDSQFESARDIVIDIPPQPAPVQIEVPAQEEKAKPHTAKKFISPNIQKVLAISVGILAGTALAAPLITLLSLTAPIIGAVIAAAAVLAVVVAASAYIGMQLKERSIRRAEGRDAASANTSSDIQQRLKATNPKPIAQNAVVVAPVKPVKATPTVVAQEEMSESRMSLRK